MARYEFSEGTSNKFWEIELKGKQVTTRWGRIGSDGQTTTKTFGSEGEARKEHDQLVAEKVKKDYQLVGGGAPKPGAGKPAAGKSNPELEKAILADPENPKPYLAYARWLEAEGDPLWRGTVRSAGNARAGQGDDRLTVGRDPPQRCVQSPQ